MTHKYGWVRDLPDKRDKHAPLLFLPALPPLVDLRPLCPPVYDQGQLGSCTANAVAGAVEFLQKKEGLPEATPSRLMIYYDERADDGDIASDSGSSIRESAKTVANVGACAETLWPYNISQFSVRPPDSCYVGAQKIRKYLSLDQGAMELQGCLADGLPFIFGFTVYESFEGATVARDGVATMPKSGESVLGGHAVMCVGYDADKRVFIVRNSWGSGWGQGGYFTLPYDYMLDPDLAADFWTLQLI